MLPPEMELMRQQAQGIFAGTKAQVVYVPEGNSIEIASDGRTQVFFVQVQFPEGFAHNPSEVAEMIAQALSQTLGMMGIETEFYGR
ncbi:hypothetical protein J7L60_01890 [Candidatus Bathyarchaeota archaeon]|nr:hypothetical protein [Candidatus Bathyarchaeota archaeon]